MSVYMSVIQSCCLYVCSVCMCVISNKSACKTLAICIPLVLYRGSSRSLLGATVAHNLLFFFQLGLALYKTEQPLQGMKLQEKEAQKY